MFGCLPEVMLLECWCQEFNPGESDRSHTLSRQMLYSYFPEKETEVPRGRHGPAGNIPLPKVLLEEAGFLVLSSQFSDMG